MLLKITKMQLHSSLRCWCGEGSYLFFDGISIALCQFWASVALRSQSFNIIVLEIVENSYFSADAKP